MINLTFNFTNIIELNKKLHEDVVDSSSTLIQLFCSTTSINDIKILQEYFRANFPKSIFIATTTDGVIEGSNVYVNTKSVVSFTIFENTSLKSALLKQESYDNDSYELGKAMAVELKEKDTKVIISFTDGIHTNGEEYVDGISSIAPNIVLSGGLAADNGELKKTYIFDKNEICTYGAIGVSLTNKNLNVATSYTFDWMPIGKEMRVTKAVKNRVYEIDGISAVDIYAKYMGEELSLQLPQVGIEFPLIFQRDGMSVGRAVLFKHNDGSLTFAGNINEGDSVRFGIGSIETILKNSNSHTRQILEKMEYKAEAVFVYSCMARRRFMNEYISDELDILSNIGHISGFFTYGEFFHTEKSNQLLNETMTILAISEGKSSRSTDLTTSSDSHHHHFGVDAQHVLAHLANRVTSELADLNANLELRIQESSDYIYKQAYFDKLTHLPNRLNLIDKLDESIGKMIILINIDDFSTINDFYGHESGDKVLKKLASLLRKVALSSKSEVFKLPSDEFAIITQICSTEATMENKIKSCILKISNENFLVGNGHNVHVSVTVGAAVVNENKTGLVNADMTLKLAKKAGKEFMIFNKDLELAKQYESNIKIANIIRNAINTDGIIPYYQPIINIKTQNIEKYEALVRLKEPNGNILSPFHFLETSQKIKLYPQITEIMIEKTFSYFAKNRKKFSINLAFSDILDEKTRHFIFSKITEYQISKQLTIEIVETQENEYASRIESFIEEVYATGANIAIDDFGSGYANFQHMTTMKSDYMKIDGSLIKDIDTDKNARLIVETIIVFAQKLKKKTIAEFVHSKEIYEMVESLGVDYAQGYYLGKPEAEVL